MWTRRRLVLAVFLTITIVSVAAGALYFERGQGPDESALATVDDDPTVTVERTDLGHTVRTDPITNSTVGIVLYPGGRVEPASYVPTAAAIAARGDMMVIIPEMPLNLAILDVDRAESIRAAHPEIREWYVGGHSLGGVSACRFAADTPESVSGVILFASYCDTDISETDLRVLSILGTADGVLDAEAELKNRENLPSTSMVVHIDGMNHSQFGAYGSQRGDNVASISGTDARVAVANKTGHWLNRTIEEPHKSD